MKIGGMLEETLKVAALRVGHVVTDVEGWGEGSYVKALEAVQDDIEIVLRKHAISSRSMTAFEFDKLLEGFRYISNELIREAVRELTRDKDLDAGEVHEVVMWATQGKQK